MCVNVISNNIYNPVFEVCLILVIVWLFKLFEQINGVDMFGRSRQDAVRALEGKCLNIFIV